MTGMFEASSVHIKLKLIGSPQKCAAFHFIVGALDPDYPAAPARMRRHPNANLLCLACDGLIYHTPMLTPHQFKGMGKQIHESNKLPGSLKVKVMMYNVKCSGMKHLFGVD